MCNPKDPVTPTPAHNFKNPLCMFRCSQMWSLCAKSQLSNFKTVGGYRCDRLTDGTLYTNNFSVMKNLTLQLLRSQRKRKTKKKFLFAHHQLYLGCTDCKDSSVNFSEKIEVFVYFTYTLKKLFLN